MIKSPTFNEESRAENEERNIPVSPV